MKTKLSFLETCQIIICLSSFLLVLSCNDDSPEPAKGFDDLVSTLLVDFPDGSGVSDIQSSYTYDSQNRLIETQFSTGERFELTYTNQKITEKQYSSSGKLMNTNLYFLNSKGLIDSSLEQNAQLSNKFFYDNSNYLVKLLSYDFNGNLDVTNYFTIAHGDVVYTETKDAAGNVLATQTNNFNTSIISSTQNKNNGQPYRGNSSIHLGTDFKRTDFNGTNSYSFEYLFDSQNRVVQIKTLSGNLINTTSLSYY